VGGGASWRGRIPVVNKLQDVFNTIGASQKQLSLDLPQIVVIGSQSSGKSSVLENIVGKGFLPRGSGICTRRPLVLQLYHNEERWLRKSSFDEDGDESSEEDEIEGKGYRSSPTMPGLEYAEFLHIPNKRFTDFDEVRREIERETERETGNNKGVSNKAIRLKVYSPNVLNLTLVDLPGMTKVPVGDQPGNIEEMIHNMCLEYVSNPLSIILAVSPANADLANSDALKLAREVDPDGNRTIGILTKLDLVDDGVDVLDALEGKVIPLKKGYVGIVNRSQAEINSNTLLQEIRRKERAFFLNHPSYRGVASRHGTEYLTKTLNTILLAHIREHLPQLKNNVKKQLRDVERELVALGTEPVDFNDKTAQGQLILGLLNKYSNVYIDSMEGRSRSSLERSSYTRGGLYGGARLAQAFKIFSERIMEISAFENLTDANIATAIMNATGPRPSLFVPELSFEVLVRRQLSYLKEPAIQCVTQVYEILQEVGDQACFSGLARFHTLQDKVLETVNDVLARNLAPTQDMIENLIRIEKAFINTSHPDFLSKLQFIRNHPTLERFERAPSSASSIGSVDSTDGRKSAPIVEEENTNLSNGNGNFISYLFNEETKFLSAKNMPSASLTTVSYLAKGGSAAILSKEEKSESDSQIRIIKKLIESYLEISRKNILDLTPKTIMFFLVNKIKDTIQMELIRQLYKEELFDELLKEDEQVALTRENLRETAELLRRGMAIINEVREFKIK